MLPDIPWIVYAIFLAPVGLILFAAAYKYFEVRAASHWPSVPGRVVKSHSEVRKVKIIDSDRAAGHRYEERNFANVVYEYVVAGKTYRNNRVSIGEDRGNFEVAETLARYPVGMAVTVYYHPRRRNEAVLERDIPKGVVGCLAWMVAISLVLVFGGAIGFNKLTEFASTRVAHAPMVVALIAFGAVAGLIGWAIQRQARQAKGWPVAKGRIVMSDMEEFRAATDDGRRGPMMYKGKTSYTYAFNGVDYTGTVVSPGSEVSSSSRRAVRSWMTPYNDGQAVDVYVNPDNPAESVLQPRVQGLWVIWICVLGLWALAAFIATRA